MESKLDELLAGLWAALSEPPLAANPYPALLGLMRARAAKLELWKVRVWGWWLGRGQALIQEAKLPGRNTLACWHALHTSACRRHGP